MLPTFFKELPRARYPRPPGGEIYFRFRGGLILRGVTAVFLLWYSLVFPTRVWEHAWVVAALLGIYDGLAVLAQSVLDKPLESLLHGTLYMDGLMGWAVAWAFDQSPNTMIPALLSLLTIELLAYYPRRTGALAALAYILITNALMGVVPGLHHQALWRWSGVMSWTGADMLIWGALLTFVQVPLRGPSLQSLTPPEREVYRLSESGLTTVEIAERLHIEASTVKSHLVHIHRKLTHGSPSPH